LLSIKSILKHVISSIFEFSWSNVPDFILSAASICAASILMLIGLVQIERAVAAENAVEREEWETI
jgi:hypothetical protein